MSALPVAGPNPAALPALTRRHRAAIIIGALGPEGAGPILETLDEGSLRSFANAMSQLRRVNPETVEATIREFLAELAESAQVVQGGLIQARALLEQYVKDSVLTRIMDDVDAPSMQNVWKKLSSVDDAALAEFLNREHPQTAAVILSKLSSEHAARVMNRMSPDRARDIVVGITKASSLDANVVEAIGSSVSRDFLATQRGDASRHKPADRVGAIMNYTSGEIRNHVLGYLDESQPEFAEQVKRKMFTFEDIPARIEKRDISAVIRQVEPETLLKALTGAETAGAAETREFILSSISSRVAEQIKEDLGDFGKVKKREAEEAQGEVIKAIRQLEANGELKMIAFDDD